MKRLGGFDVRAASAALFMIAAASAAAPCLAQSVTPAPLPQAGPLPDAAGAVQPYGILDAAVRRTDAVSTAGGATQFVAGLNTSRVGLRGKEVIDSDWQASFRLETGFSPGTGTQSNSTSLFDRTATVGLRWKSIDFKAGRQEGFGYELAANGSTDPLQMALNLPNYSSPAAAGSKAPILGANPLQGLYSYTYGQLRFNNSLRLSTDVDDFSVGVFYALGGVAGDSSAASVRAGHLGWHAGPGQIDAVYQQSQDLEGHHSSLYVLAGAVTVASWKLQAGVHDLKIGAGFNSTNIGNGASSSGILGTSTTVATVLATAKEDFTFRVSDVGATWTVAPGRLLTFAAYKSQTQGAGSGDDLALAVIGKWYLSPRTCVYVETDHENSSGRLAIKPVSGSTIATAYMLGLNVRF
jgi:predicted porin